MLEENKKSPLTFGELFDEIREKGMESGMAEAKLEITQELIQEGFSDEEVVQIAKLDLEEVVELRRSMQD